MNPKHTLSESAMLKSVKQTRDYAEDLKDKGEYQEAHLRWLSLWHLCVQVYGENSVEALEAMMELAESFFSIGDAEEATDIFGDAIKRCEEFLGANHNITGNAYQGLANMLSYADKCLMAEPHMRKALEIKTLNFGHVTDETARVLHDLGLLLMRADDYEVAEGVLRESLCIFKRIKNIDDPTISTVMHSLGHTLYLRGKLEDAKYLLEKVILTRESVLGTHHPDLAQSLRMLGDILDGGDSPELAAPLYARALAIQEEVFEPNHPQVLYSQFWYADYLERFSKLDDALALFIRLEDIKLRHPDSGCQSLETIQQRITNLRKLLSTFTYFENPLIDSHAPKLDSLDQNSKSRTLH